MTKKVSQAEQNYEKYRQTVLSIIDYLDSVQRNLEYYKYNLTEEIVKKTIIPHIKKQLGEIKFRIKEVKYINTLSGNEPISYTRNDGIGKIVISQTEILFFSYNKESQVLTVEYFTGHIAPIMKNFDKNERAVFFTQTPFTEQPK